MTDSNSIPRSLFFKTDYAVLQEDVVTWLDNFSKRDDLNFYKAPVSKDKVVKVDVRDTLSYNVSVNVGNDEDHIKFDSIMFELVSQCIQYYSDKFPLFNYTEDSGYEILKYATGGHYKFHSDQSDQSPRVLTFIYYLNDDYEGGEFQMWEDGSPIKMPKGSVAIFPSSDYFSHTVLPVTKGERRAVITWLENVTNDDKDG